MLYERNIVKRLTRSLKHHPVVLLNGARQVGKSTLIANLIEQVYPASYLNLDDHTFLLAASHDPFSFLEKYSGAVAIDEIQRSPELLIAIKRLVDQRQQNGQFLLTGSANVLTMPKVSESLAGRMVVHHLWPLSQGEILDKQAQFIDWTLTSNTLPAPVPPFSQQALMDRLITGGYPRALMAADQTIRQEWMGSYIDALLQRDIRQLSNIDGLREMPRLLAILAERVGNLLNLADVARIMQLNQTTLKRYYALLQMIFLVIEIPAWFSSREKRLAKSPKIYFNDTGLVCYLKQVMADDFLQDRARMGALLENFVVMELKKQLSWQDSAPTMYHFRTQSGQEVDIVLEGKNKKIVGIEVKASSKIDKRDLRGLQTLQKMAGETWLKGVVLYTGEHCLALTESIYAIPVQGLWEI